MYQHLRANLALLLLTVGISSVLYPLALFAIGQTLFHEKAEGSFVRDRDGEVVGSRLIAQPFTSEEYFHPRPSAASYNGMASSGSNLAANNYLLRDRVAKTLGPIVKYASGPKKGQRVAPDIETWFQTKKYKDDNKDIGVVARWARDHSMVARNWVNAAKANTEFVAGWMQQHPQEVETWKKRNAGLAEPKPEDLAVPFFENFSEDFPGTFPSLVEHKLPDGKTEQRLEPVKEGTDIQSTFFDLWRQDHLNADLEQVPADMVMASGSGLDPHITLANGLYQLDRVAQAWAKKMVGDADEEGFQKDEAKRREYQARLQQAEAKVKNEIQTLLQERAEAVLDGTIRVPILNVLEINLALRDRYAPRAASR